MEINELIQIFLYELQEESNEFYTNLQNLENEFTSGGKDLIPLINDMFISIHTIKGSASTLHNSIRRQNHPLAHPLKIIAKITHEFEDYIDLLKEQEKELTLEDFEVMYEFDQMLNRLQDSLKNQDNLYPEENANSFLKKIKNKANTDKRESPETDCTISSNKLFFNILLSCEEDFKHGYLSLVYRDIENQYKHATFSPTKEELLRGTNFDIISIQINTDASVTTVKHFLESLDNVTAVSHIPYQPPKKIEYANENSSKQLPSSDAQHEKDLPKRTKKMTQPLRIDPTRIDNVLKYTSQLVILGNKFDEFLNQSNFLAGTKKRKELEAIFDDINMNIEFLQSSVLEIRMTPFEQLFSRFPRDVKSLSHKYKKPINFKTIGGSTEIDKAILDELSEPFIHLLRNSIIHGIEPPEDRLKKGKPKEGNITVHAKHDKNRVIIKISDDGKGMDIQGLKESALSKKIITTEQLKNLHDDEVLSLIFKPGVSSTKQVDEYSGRGMGMEAVRKKIDEINGAIFVDSKKEEGTTITLTLPLTTAIIEGMVSKINNEYFTFPITQVEEVTSISLTDIKTSSGQRFILLNDKEIPIVHAEEFFNFEKYFNTTESPPFLKVIILTSQNQSVGLTIDEYLGQQSIVVKSLHPFIQHSQGISNCHILGDGSISLIVDSNDLFDYIKKPSE